ncbi:hypothetical protein MTO96_031227 [Rhipicephalus appendiculatus]
MGTGHVEEEGKGRHGQSSIAIALTRCSPARSQRSMPPHRLARIRRVRSGPAGTEEWPLASLGKGRHQTKGEGGDASGWLLATRFYKTASWFLSRQFTVWVE